MLQQIVLVPSDYILGYLAFWDGVNLSDLGDDNVPSADMVNGWWQAKNEIERGIEPDDL